MNGRSIELSPRCAETADSLTREFGFKDESATVEAALECLRVQMSDPETRRLRLRELILEGLREYDEGKYVVARNEEELHRVLDEARDRGRNHASNGQGS
jgi:Arc/MetJ-type ribon-helix-helix transcriptional regulator